MRGSAVSRLQAGDHVVHFYEDDEELVSVVAAYLLEAVGRGGAAIVIASPEHRAAVVAALRDGGADAAAAEAEGRLVLLDAAATLERFRVQGEPDAGSFDAVVGAAVRAAGAGGRPVHAYGEMLALLWDAGDVVAALELERLWNDLAAETPFSLLCAYPRHQMEPADRAPAVGEICRLHSDVVAPAPVLEHADAMRRFPCNLHAPSLARRFVTDVMAGWGCDAVAGDARLVVTELASNAVAHARSSFAVSLTLANGTLRIAVGDCARELPHARPLDDDSSGGRGLHLVEVLAARWGHVEHPAGKLVWADFVVPGERVA